MLARLAASAIDPLDPLWRDRPFDRWRARLDLLMMAAPADGCGAGLELRAGELCASFRILSERWGWSRKVCRNFMEHLTRERVVECVPEAAIQARGRPYSVRRNGNVWRVVDYLEMLEGHTEGHTETTENTGLTPGRGTPRGTPAAAPTPRPRSSTPESGAGHAGGHTQITENTGLTPGRGMLTGTPGRQSGVSVPPASVDPPFEGHAQTSEKKEVIADGGTPCQAAERTYTLLSPAPVDPPQEKKKKKRVRHKLPDVPPQLDTPEFRTAWEKRLRERSQRRKTYVPEQVREIFRDLVALAEMRGVEFVVQRLGKAVKLGWGELTFREDFKNDPRQGTLFAPKERRPGRQGGEL